jgi:Na+/H+ antiporter NhaD/arsenite permease-like protein
MKLFSIRPKVIVFVIGILLVCSFFTYSAEEAGEGNLSQDGHGTEHSASNEEHHDQSHGGHHGVDGASLPLWSIIPFVGILLSIAIAPLVAEHFWHHHYGKVSLVWSLIFGIPYLAAFRGDGFYDILHIYLLDYIPFIVLLWGLYTIAGGILVRGTLRGTPTVNTLILLIGTAIASWVGTTGASMLLIRPMIRANAYRQKKVHLIVFFIFLVSNIGGSLTPLGDPPLFLGFLHGVPFFWTMTILPHMVVVSVLILYIFFCFDSLMFKREGGQVPDDGTGEALRVDGAFNLIFLLGVMGAVLMSGMWKPNKDFSVFGVHLPLQNLAREVIIIFCGLLSLKFTPISDELRQTNGFTWFPIEEVGKLFAGIFITMIPAIAILRAGNDGVLSPIVGMFTDAEGQSINSMYFWMTGVLSGFLDNAPTYLVFFNLAGSSAPEATSMAEFLMHQIPNTLTAISAGAVFMGAMTYIGNAPNFMVQSIAEENNVKMPSFFGYMLWSFLILGPLYFILSIIIF